MPRRPEPIYPNPDVAYRQRGTVDVVDAGLFAHAAEQEKSQWYASPFLHCDELLIAGHAGEILLGKRGQGVQPTDLPFGPSSMELWEKPSKD